MVRQVPVSTCRYVAEERVESIPVTTCQMVAEERVEPYGLSVLVAGTSGSGKSILTKGLLERLAHDLLRDRHGQKVESLAVAPVHKQLEALGGVHQQLF